MGEDDEEDNEDYGWSDTPVDGEPDPFADDLDLGQDPVVIVPTFQDRVDFFVRRGLSDAEAMVAAREYDGPL